ncbi:hypothetical protein TeGR_g12099, partial [Tetraparma gracilis]
MSGNPSLLWLSPSAALLAAASQYILNELTAASADPMYEPLAPPPALAPLVSFLQSPYLPPPRPPPRPPPVSHKKKRPALGQPGGGGGGKKSAMVRPVPPPECIPCPSRSQPAAHANAYICIAPRPQHGARLTCSDAACRQQGTKFRWCDVCARPVASRNFSKRHSHGRAAVIGRVYHNGGAIHEGGPIVGVGNAKGKFVYPNGGGPVDGMDLSDEGEPEEDDK